LILTLLKHKRNKLRIGFGYDIHRLAEGRDFWLGGIIIPHTKGALGHSDADVLIHAIIDALFGAASLGDIGTHFPDTSPEFKGIDSKMLLMRAMELISAKGYRIGNLDATIVLQTPKLQPFIPEMKKILAPILRITEDDLSIKAKTSEKLGFVGKEEGIEAFATVLLIDQNG
jgi:2-C-methyl-D-erythritol 2,4-cyclodiphosphate synthase